MLNGIIRRKYPRSQETMRDYKRDVFISYHTSTAADQVRKIAAALEGAGISCWYAPRDCAPQFAEEIVRAIRGCRVFLLLLNTGSNQSEHCKQYELS